MALARGYKQQIAITSEPAGAEVTGEKGELLGTTPCEITVPRAKGIHVWLWLRKPGFRTVHAALVGEEDSLLFVFEFVLGVPPLIAGAIDVVTGALEYHQPAHFTLTRTAAAPTTARGQ